MLLKDIHTTKEFKKEDEGIILGINLTPINTLIDRYDGKAGSIGILFFYFNYPNIILYKVTPPTPLNIHLLTFR